MTITPTPITPAPTGLEPTAVEADETIDGHAPVVAPDPLEATETTGGLVPPILRVPSPWRRRGAAFGWGAVGVAGFIALWQVGSTTTELPGPGETFEVLGELLGDAFEPDGPAGQGVGLHMRDSISKVLRGFVLAALIGMPIGLLLGVSRRAHQIANPIVQLLRPVSPLAWFPIWLTVMVTSEPASIGVIFITAVWPVILNTAAGAASVPSYQRNVAEVFRFSRWTRLREITVPHTLPQAITGLRLSLGIAWMVIVAAEMLSAASGIGFYIWQSYNGQGLTYVMAAIILIGMVGLTMDAGFQWLGRRVAHEEVRP
jgi:nitrate/nitrite transport system permease protein